MTLPSGHLSMEDMRNLSTEQLYELMFTCQSPGHYQFSVEELQRRFLTQIGVETQKLAESSARVEALTTSLETTVTNVGMQIQSLTESSRRMERLTRWLIGLTIALFFLTAVQVVIILAGVNVVGNYLTFLGLCSDIVGAILILSGVYVSRHKAIEIGVTRFASEKPEENLTLPSVANLLFQSRQAVLGTLFLITGFVLQALAVWPF